MSERRLLSEEIPRQTSQSPHTTTMDLPTLDLALFTKGTVAERQKCAEKIVDSFRNHGFVKLTNHGIPEETVKSYMGAVSSPILCVHPPIGVREDES